MIYWSEFRSWLKRHRWLAITLSVAFLIFEISRAASIGGVILAEVIAETGGPLGRWEARSPWILARNLSMAAIFFAAPMAAVVYVGLKIRRRLSRYWTAVNRQG